jgi:hypothetical protein
VTNAKLGSSGGLEFLEFPFLLLEDLVSLLLGGRLFLGLEGEKKVFSACDLEQKKKKKKKR